MYRSLARPFTFLAAISFLSIPSALSDPVGVYAIIDRVEMFPNEELPEEIRIHGVFALSDGQSGDYYLAPQRGQMYYRVNPQNARATRAEWADLKSIAGAGRGIGYGARYARNGRVRMPGESPGAKSPEPDIYPLGFGLVRDPSWHLAPQIIAGLRLVPQPLSPVGQGVASGEVRLVARNVDREGVRYVFMIDGSGQHEMSPPIPAGEKETAWTPRLRVQAGQTYTWKVHVLVGSNDMAADAAVATFTVR
jgi:hypothetical protein